MRHSKCWLVLGYMLFFFSACYQAEQHTAPVIREVGIFDYLGPDFWQTRAKAQAIIRDGKLHESTGNFAFALGKFQQAYRLSPQETQLPLMIARNYARIARGNPAASYEKQKPLDWMYRAFLVDAAFGEAVFHDADFRILENEDVFKALKKNFGLSSDREILSVLQRLTSMARETQVVVAELGGVVRVVSVWLGVGGWERAVGGRWLGFGVVRLGLVRLGGAVAGRQ